MVWTSLIFKKICINKTHWSKTFHLLVEINNYVVEGLVDTGASTSIMVVAMVKKLGITRSFFYQIKNFFHLWISQEENLKMFWKLKNIGKIYKEINLKKRNWIFKLLICAWITPLQFQWKYLSHFFIKLRNFYNIGYTKRRITIFLECSR